MFANSAAIPIPMAAHLDIGEVAAQALMPPPASSESAGLIDAAHSERPVSLMLGAGFGRASHVAVTLEEGRVEAFIAAGLLSTFCRMSS